MRLHDELVQRAAQWLRAKCPVVITEMTSAANETPDAIGFTGHRSILIECKTSMADFRADGNKPSRRRDRPSGEPTWQETRWLRSTLGDQRYYLVPEAISGKVLTALTDEASEWGLLSAPPDGDKRLRRLREPTDRYMENLHGGEISLLMSALRRVTGGTKGVLKEAVYVKAYTIIKGQGEPRATMGIRPED